MKGPNLNRSRIVTMAAATALVAGLGGCATTSQLDELRADVDAAKADASAAKAEAAAASKDAAEARAMAADAVNTANEAKATSEETETKIDRMFKKAMYK